MGAYDQINYTVGIKTREYWSLESVDHAFKAKREGEREGYLDPLLPFLLLAIDLRLEELPPGSSAYSTEPGASNRRIMLDKLVSD